MVERSRNGKENPKIAPRDTESRAEGPLSDGPFDRERFLSALIDTATEGYWAIDESLRTVDVNAALCNMLGYGRKEMLGQTPLDFVVDSHRHIFEHQFAIRDSMARRSYDIVLRTKGGELVPVHVIGTTVRDNEGRVIGSCAFYADLRRSQAVADALQGGETWFRRIVEDSPLGITMIGRDGRYLMVNDAFCALVGRDREALLTMRFADITHPDDIESSEMRFAAQFQEHESYPVTEKRYVDANGNVIWVTTFGGVVCDDSGKPVCVVRHIQDITERRQGADVLEARLRLETFLTELSTNFVSLPPERLDDEIERALDRLIAFLGVDRVSIFEFDPDTGNLCALWGRTVGEVSYRPPPVPAATYPQMLAGIKAGHILVVPDTETPPEAPDQETTELYAMLRQRDVRANLGIPLVFEGKVIGALTCSSMTRRMGWNPTLLSRLRLLGDIFSNVLIRRRTARDLRQSEDRFLALIDHSPAIIVLKDAEGRHQVVNAEFTRRYGLTTEQVYGKTAAHFLPAAAAEKIAAIERRVAATGEVISTEMTLPQTDGTEHWVLSTRFPIRDVDGRIIGIGLISSDITEHKAADARFNDIQSQLAHASRLSTIGELAAGFAHELNQPLTAITNYTRGGLRRLHAGTLTKENTASVLEQVSEQALRAGEVIRRIRSFIRKEETPRSLVAPERVIDESLAFLAGDIRNAGIAVQTDLEAGIGPAFMDIIQIQQVVMNLIRNAVEAISASGTEAATIRIEVRQDGQSAVRISVIDSGPGIPERLRTRLFEPFLTTKATGMGIGLTICKTIIEAHGGRLSVESRAGGGTIAAFTLPTGT